jgi:hypothetical protein
MDAPGQFLALTIVAALGLCASGCTEERKATATAPGGAPTSAKVDALKAGAAALQTHAPLAGMNMYLVGFHPLKNDPEHQMEAHHFCRQVNEDFAQCALFDGNTAASNLNGIEYIISGKLFESLPPEERRYWHPHNGEILSGQLVAPGIPQPAEKELMRSKMNSYGKTWHVWMTDREDKLPVGEPTLAWSFNREGEARPGLIEERDKRMGIDTAGIRQARQELVSLAKPQAGVDELEGKFSRPVRDIPGVIDRRAAAETK